MDLKERLVNIYKKLYATFGPQNWWPGDTPFEVAVGAVLTQNTNWRNVEKAINNLKAEGALRPAALYDIPSAQLAALIRPAGHFNVKARRLRNFLEFFISEYNGEMRRMKRERMPLIRKKLLSVNGIGPETADSIILYALEKPVFVIDAYTKRVLSRHNILDHTVAYNEFQELFHVNLKKDVRLFNEYHALFVRVAKEYCRTKPVCGECPIERM
jgi:endonuclease-3 related protein